MTLLPFKKVLITPHTSSVASPICQEGQSERNFPIFAFSSRIFLFFPEFFAVRGGTLPPLPPQCGPQWLHHCLIPALFFFDPLWFAHPPPPEYLWTLPKKIRLYIFVFSRLFPCTGFVLDMDGIQYIKCAVRFWDAGQGRSWADRMARSDRMQARLDFQDGGGGGGHSADW